MFEDEFARRLRKIRIKRKFTQQEVADFLNVSRSTYTYYETGKTEPSLENILKLSKLYKVSTDFLINGKKFDKIIDRSKC